MSDWEQHAQVMAKLDQLFAVMFNSNKSEEAPQYKPSPPSDFLPVGFRDEQKVDIGQQMQVAASGLASKTAKVVYGDDD